MHGANSTQKPKPASLDDVVTALAELQKLAEAAAEAQQPKLVRSTMSVREKIAHIHEHGQENYLSLPYA